MKPNASLITFLTLSDEFHEKIIFLYLKELEEIPPSFLYWYEKRGRFGKATYLWKKRNLRQWVAIGSNEEIKQLWESLCKSSEIEINFADRGEKSAKKTFIIPKKIKEISKEEPENIYLIQGVTPCGGKLARYYYTIENWDKDIGHSIEFLLEETILSYLEGYVLNKEIKPIYPLGLFEKGFLYKMLAKKVIAVKENKGIFWTLKGINNEYRKKDDPKAFIGFIQKEPSFRKNYIVRLCNIDDKNCKETNINPETGYWKVDLEFPIGQGNFYIFDKTKICPICGEKFHLIKDIVIDIHKTTGIFKDLFGREFTYSSDDLITYTIMKKPFGFIWNREIYPDENIAEIDLSDKISEIIAYLGPKILISDPYLLGQIKAENGIPKLTSGGQKVFINALLIAFTKCKIEELWLLGHSAKIKKQAEIPIEEIRDTYKHVFKKFNQFTLKKVILKFTERSFHDRHWIGLRNTDEDEVYRVTNSISGLTKSGELEIISVGSTEKIRIISRILKRWDSTEERCIIDA